MLDEHWLSNKRDVMVIGANAAGKTRWLLRLHSQAARIWKKQPALLLRAVDPIGAWTADPRVMAYMEATSGEPWRSTKCWEHAEWLVRWVKENRAVVLLDDAHLLAGRKLQALEKRA